MAVVEEIERHLTARIGAGAIKYGERLPSRSDLAAQFNTSPATVSNAVQRLSEKHDLKFVPGKGVFLQAESEKKPLVIGLIGGTPSRYAAGMHPDSFYWRPILHSLMDHACEHDCALLAIPKTSKEPIDIDRIADCGVDCVISYTLQLSEQTVLELRRRGIPLVLGNRGDGHLPLLGASYVDYDNMSLHRDVVRLFHTCGHRRIAYVGAESSDDAWTSWRDAFVLEVGNLGLHYPYHDYIRVQAREEPRHNADMIDFITRETIALLDLPEPPTAIFYHVYTPFLQPALAAVTDRNLTIGKDLSVIGLAVESHEAMPPISAYVPQADLLGRTVIEAAGKLVDNPHGVFQVDVPFTYVNKGSVGEKK